MTFQADGFTVALEVPSEQAVLENLGTGAANPHLPGRELGHDRPAGWPADAVLFSLDLQEPAVHPETGGKLEPPRTE